MKWWLKQLVPLTYHSWYKDSANNTHFCVWCMWFGQCFMIKDVTLV